MGMAFITVLGKFTVAADNKYHYSERVVMAPRREEASGVHTDRESDFEQEHGEGN